MRNVLIAMICIVMVAALFGCVRQALATTQPTFIDDGNGAYVAAVREECKSAILAALLKDPEQAKTLTVEDLQAAQDECVAQQGVRSI